MRVIMDETLLRQRKMSLQPGTKVKHYLINDLIATGGMGVVWHAWDIAQNESKKKVKWYRRKQRRKGQANNALLSSAHPETPDGHNAVSYSFLFRNEQFFARSRKPRDCAEAYRGTSHKQSPRLTQRLRKRAISGWKLSMTMENCGGSMRNLN